MLRDHLLIKFLLLVYPTKRLALKDFLTR